MKFLNNYKTYLGMIVYGIIHSLLEMGVVSAGLVAIADPMIYTWTGIAVKHSWDKKNSK